MESEIAKEINRLHDEYIHSDEFVEDVRNECYRMQLYDKIDKARIDAKYRTIVDERIHAIEALMNSLNCDLEKAMTILEIDLSQKEHYQKCINQR